MQVRTTNLTRFLYSLSLGGQVTFRMLFRSSKLKARRSLLPQFCEKWRSSLRKSFQICHQMGLAEPVYKKGWKIDLHFSQTRLLRLVCLMNLKFLSKTFRFSIIFHSTLQNFGGATFEKHADLEKKNRNSWKSLANSRNLSEPFLWSRICTGIVPSTMPEEFFERALHC